MTSAGGAQAWGRDDEFSAGLVKCEGLEEGHPSGQPGIRGALEVIKC